MLQEIVQSGDEPEAISSLHTSPAKNAIIISVTYSDTLILTKHCPFPFQPTNLRRKSNPSCKEEYKSIKF